MSDSLQRVFRYSSNDDRASLRWGMAYGMLFNMISAFYHVHVRLNVLHLLCVCIVVTKYQCRTAYKGFFATVATMRELALGEGCHMVCAVYHVYVWLNVLHLLCVCIGLTKYLCRTAYKGFSASVATMRELALGEGWHMVCSSTWYLQSIMFKSDWMCYIYYVFA